MQYEITEMYTEYFNFALEKIILREKQLEEGELWKLLYELLDLVVTLKERKIGMIINLSNVFLTLKGQVVVYVHHLMSF